MCEGQNVSADSQRKFRIIINPNKFLNLEHFESFESLEHLKNARFSFVELNYFNTQMQTILFSRILNWHLFKRFLEKILDYQNFQNFSRTYFRNFRFQIIFVLEFELWIFTLNYLKTSVSNYFYHLCSEFK